MNTYIGHSKNVKCICGYEDTEQGMKEHATDCEYRGRIR